MKISRLLVLSALGLWSLGANAADLVERVAPTNDDVQQVPVAFQAGKTYLLYNVGTQKFYTQGNSWGTRSSVGPLSEAIRVHLDEYVPEGQSLTEVTYQFFNYSCVRTRTYSWHQSWFSNDQVQMYTDLASQADKYWAVDDQGGNTYRLKAAQINPEVKSDGTQFVGYQEGTPLDESNLYADLPNEEIFPLMSKLTEAEGNHIDWQFFDASIYDVFDKAEELKAVITAAEEKGVDVSAAAAVYNDLSATIEQMQAAIDALNKAMTDNTFAGFTPGTALDVTSLIVNPDFAGGNLTNGWSGTTFGAYQGKDNAEHYNRTFDTYQTVSGLRPGLYVVGVNAFYRAGNAATAYTNFKAQNDESKYSKFYVKSGDETLTVDIVSPYQGAPTSGTGKGSESSAKDDATGITYYIPNNMVAAEYYMHNLGLYKNNIFANITGSEITIGVKKEKTVSEDWSIFDDFSLIYCGSDDQAYKAYVNYYKKLLPDYKSQRTEYTNDFAALGINYTTSYMDAFDAFESTAASEAEALADVEKLMAIYEPLRLNVELWNEFKTTVQKALETAGNNKLDPDYTAPLADWADLDAEDLWNLQELTNEQLRELIDQKNAEIEEAGRHLIGDGETDVTYLLKDPGFEEGTLGWTREAAAGGNVAKGGNDVNHCYEAWNNANFDIYQVVKNAPQGIYRIEVQGFYRYGRGNDAWNAYQDQQVSFVQKGGAPVFVYLNGKATPFQNVFDEKQEPGFYTGDYYTDPNGEFVYPNQMNNSAEAFSAGMYKQSAYGIIKSGQDMRIGVKGTSNQLGDSWVIWDNFKLFNCGKNAAAVMNVLPDEIANAEAMLEQNMGKSIYDALQAAVDAAKASLDTQDGETMFNALSNLFDAEADVAASVALFKQLADANEEFLNAIGNSLNRAAQEEASNLYQEIIDKMEAHEMENDDVDDYIAKIDEMMTKLAIPEDVAKATDLDPKELTGVIRNNDFAANNANNWRGTAAGFQTFGNAEMFNKNFNFYQDINGLPAGIYELQVQGYYRSGEAVDDYKNFNENPEAGNNAFLYAMTIGEAGDSIYSSNALKRLASAAQTDLSEVPAGYVAVKTETIDQENSIYNYTVVANNMETAATEFDLGNYTANSVIAKVGANGKLRVGVMKRNGITNDWTIFDNFKLFYYGTSSEKQATPDGIETVGNAPALTVEFFTLDGRKASAAQRGLLIMKQTLSNGAVIVKKIQK